MLPMMHAQWVQGVGKVKGKTNKTLLITKVFRGKVQLM